MKNTFIAFIATFMFMGAISSLEGMDIFSCQIASSSFAAGAEVPLIKLSVTNDESFVPREISNITFSYTGTNVNDLNPLCVFFSYDFDGNRSSMSDDIFLASAAFSSSGIMTANVNWEIQPLQTRYLYLDIILAKTSLTDGSTISAQINSGGIVPLVYIPIDVIYPLKSLNKPSAINITASTATVHDWTAALTAGQTGTAIADAVDPYGNIDLSFTGDSLQLSGYIGYEPGVSAGGFSPVYAGTGAWIAADHGRKTLSYTLYKAETGRRLLVKAGLLPAAGVVSSEISVTAIAASSATVHDWTTTITAGQTGTAIADAIDPYGNIDLSFTGDSLQLSGYSGYEPGVSASGFSPVYAGTGAWISADHGRKTLSYTLYKAETGRRLLVKAGLLPAAGVVSSEISVTAIAASSATVHDWSTTITAGQTGTAIADAIDPYGNIDLSFTGDSLQLSGYIGYEPGVSAGGFSPVYAGTGAWIVANHGRKTLSYTLYKAETGRRLLVKAGLLPAAGVVSSEISVTAIAASSATVHDWTTTITAGQTGTAIADAIDPYGNIDLSFTGDSLQLSGYSGYEPGVSVGGFSPVYAGTGAWISADHGRKTLSYTLYKVETGRKLLVQAGLLPTEGVISPEISVTMIAGIAALVHDWTTALTAGQAGTVMVDAVDSSGNICMDFFGELLQLSGYSGYEPGVSAGGFDPVYAGTCTWIPADEGRKTLSYTLYKAETGRKLVVESTLLSTSSLVSPEISVEAAPRNSYNLEAPASVSGGVEFPAGIAAKDMFGNIDTAFTGVVNITVPEPGRIAPASVTLVNGVWSGNLRLSNDIASPVITITDGSVYSEARGVVGVAVSDSSQAIAYPSVFNPKARPLKIRYNLAANTAVSIKIYDMAGECGKEINCAAGSAGGQAGINIIFWDGRDGGGNFGHSGLYKILIDKGYEKQWIKAVIKNY